MRNIGEKVKITKKKEVQKTLKNARGITLIALVITIIVLLILAGVTIATLTGNNGILTRAQEAKTKTTEAEDIEKIRLAMSEAQIGENGYQELNQNSLQEALASEFEGRNVIASDNGDGTFTISCLDTLKDYTISGNNIEEGIDWNEAMANAVAPESQDEERNEGVIGIGTDGKPVDMDLWEYTFDSNTEGYALNTIEDLNGTKRENGYKGEIDTLTGKIEGTIPQYIKNVDSNSYIAVTNLYDTFRGLNELKTISKIPSTVINMSCSFELCSNLEKIPQLPANVTDISWAFHGTGITYINELPETIEMINGTFYGCNNLQNVEIKIPDKVLSTDSLFKACENLKKISIQLNNSVENIGGMFTGCIGLESCNITIPKNVKDTHMLFENCYKLGEGKIIIESKPDNYDHMFFNVATDAKTLIVYSGDDNKDFVQTIINNSRNNNNANIKGSWE